MYSVPAVPLSPGRAGRGAIRRHAAECTQLLYLFYGSVSYLYVILASISALCTILLSLIYLSTISCG
jgi:hypothetical protein